MRTVDQWLSEYGESHQNHTNKLIHWICVPLIFFSIVGLLYSIKLPWFVGDYRLNVAVIALILVAIYYLRMSLPLGIAMIVFIMICLSLCFLIENKTGLPLWMASVIIFVLAWIGQFYGHKVEGKKPSFLKDLQFLLIGPMWLMSFLFKRSGITY
jgi:uncharacterized membrane protein YGL010W